MTAMFGRLSFGTVRGIPVSASGSWLLVVFVLTWLASDHFQEITTLGPTGSVLLAAFAVTLFFGSVIAHELGHAVAAQRSGIIVRGIELWMFGGVAHLGEAPRTPREELRIAAAGPFVTFLLAVLLLGGGLLADPSGISDAAAGETASPVLAVIALIGALNVVVLLLNLLPAYPLDGGVIAHAIAWRVTGDRHGATRLAGTAGQVIGYLLLIGGIGLAWTTDAMADGFSIALLGFLITVAARASVINASAQQRLDRVTVGAIADPSVAAVDGTHTILEATDRGGPPGTWVVVRRDGRPAALLPAGAIDEALAKGQPALTLGELADEEPDRTIDSDAPLRELTTDRRLSGGGALLAVTADGTPLGIVTASSVAQAVALAARGR